MDTNRATRQQPPALRPTGTDRSAEPADGSREGSVDQPLLFDPLPFDDEADRPVSFTLTARAKRVVAPQELPALSVVRDRVSADATAGSPDGTGASPGGTGASPGGTAGSLDGGWPTAADPSDTRPSRARALRRAGRSPAAIAEQLGVDPLLVRAWVGAVSGAATSVPTVDAGPTPSTTAAVTDGQPDPSQPAQQETSFQLARAAASEEARARLRHDPGFAAGLGLLASIAEFDLHAVTVTTGEQDVAAAVLHWLDEHLAVDPGRVRVVLRVGPGGAGDLVRYRWAVRLGIDRDRVALARWREAPDREAVQALLRVADPGVAATVAGWRDALLAPSGSDPADVAF